MRAGSAVAIGLILLLGSPVGWAGQISKRQALKEKFQTKNVGISNQQYEPYSSVQSPQSPPVSRKEESADRQRQDGQQEQNYREIVDELASQRDQETTEAGGAGGARIGQVLSGNKTTVLPRPSSIDYAIYQANYDADIEEDIALVKERVTLEVFRKVGVTRIPLVNAGVGLKEVSLNNRASMINREGNRYVLLIEKPGRYTLDAQFFVKVQREREHGPGQFNFEVLPSPISLIDVQISEPQMDVFVEPSIKIEKEFTSQKTLATAVLPYTEQLTIRWTKAAERIDLTPIKLEPRLTVETETLASIGEGIAQFTSRLRYSILQSEISNLKVALPQDVAVLDVRGVELRDWKVAPHDGRQVVDVYLTRGVKGAYELTVTYEKTLGEGSVTTQLPEILAIGVDRDRGHGGIQARSNVELSFAKLSDATEIDVKELPASLWGQASHPVLLAYQYLKHPYTIEIEVRKHDDVPVLVATIDNAHALTLMTAEGKMLTGATFQVRNNVKQFVRLELPEGATLLSCFVSGQPVKPAKDARGHILIPLQKSEAQGQTITQFPVEVVYRTEERAMGWWGKLPLHLPRLDIPIGQLQWSLYAPEKFNYWKAGGDMDWVDQESLWTGTRLLRRALQASTRGLEDLQQGSVAQYAAKEEELYGVMVMKSQAVQGILPIRVDIPMVGRAIRLSKLLVTTESPSIVLGYLRNAAKVGWLFALVLFGLILWVGQRLERRILKGERLSSGDAVLLLATAAAIVASVWLGHVGIGLVLFALFICATALLISRLRRWVSHRRKATPDS